MAMGTRRRRQRQEELWYRRDLAEAPGHPFYRRLNEVLDQAGFDEFCEARCRQFYHEKLGPPVSGSGDVLPGDAEVFGLDDLRCRIRIMAACTSVETGVIYANY